MATDTHLECSQLLADVSEDLAIELLAEFEDADFPHLSFTIEKLFRVKSFLEREHAHVPPTLDIVLKIYKTKTS
jgi:hypothetical protein